MPCPASYSFLGKPLAAAPDMCLQRPSHLTVGLCLCRLLPAVSDKALGIIFAAFSVQVSILGHARVCMDALV